MANQTVKIDLSVEDTRGSMRERISEGKAYNKELEKSKQLTAASMQYGRARGTSGLTGASARDFANEQQGLGGLVRIYATVAANTYAAVSAFNALKNALDTTNMVKGLDQLGATSGIALGALAQNFVKATDGAISLREAMSAVAKGTSAGLSSKQMLQVGDAAKKASQALGIDATDAVSRLTRGITKLEPELLDELGIFTKIEKATEDYARSIGKPVTALTDFQRRQAFANAVLKEANDKFKDIDIPANPYKQLEASIINLTQAGLSLINKFIGPLASVLANNSGLLTLALVGLASKLLTMAIPALTQWQDNLKQAAKVAKEKAEDINTSFGEKFVEKIQAKYDLPKFNKNLQDAERQYTQSVLKFNKIDEDYQKSKVASLSAGDKDILEKAKIAKQKAAYDQDYIDRKYIADAEKINQAAGEKTLEIEKRRTAALNERKTAEDAVTKAQKVRNDAENIAYAKADKFDAEAKAREVISRKAGARSERLSILSEVTSETEAGGFGYAIDQLNKRINTTRDMNQWDKFRTQVTGAFYAAAVSVSIFASALSAAFGIVGVLVGVITLLYSAFSKAEKELASLEEASRTYTSTIENAERVSKKFGDTISAIALNARSTSLRDLGDQANDLAEKYTTAIQKMSLVEGAWDKIKELVSFGNLGVKADFSENVSKGIIAQIKLIPEGPAKEELKEKLKKIFQVGNLTEVGLEKRLQGETTFTVDKLAKQAQAALAPVVNTVIAQNDKVQDFKSSLDAANKAGQNLVNTLANKDPITEFGNTMLDTSLKLSDLFKDPATSAIALQEILNNPKAFELLGVSTEQLKEYVKPLQQYTKDVELLNSEIAAVRKNKGQLEASLAKGGQSSYTRQLTLQGIKEAESRLQNLEINLTVSDRALNGIKENIERVTGGAINNALSLLNQRANIERQRNEIAGAKSLLSGVSGAGVAAATTKLDIADLNLQKSQLDLTLKLVNEAQLSRIIGEKSLAESQKQTIIQLAQQEKRPLTADEQKIVSGPEAKVINEQLKLVQNFLADSSAENQRTLENSLGKLDGVARREALIALSTMRGAQVQRGNIDAQIGSLQALGRVQQGAESRALQAGRLGEQERGAELALEQFNLETKALSVLTEQQISTKNKLEAQVLAKKQAAELFKIESDIAGIQDRLKEPLAASIKQELERNLVEKQRQRTELVAAQNTKRNNESVARTQKEIENASKGIVLSRQSQYALDQLIQASDQEEINYKNQLLQISEKLNLSNTSTFAFNQNILKNAQQELDYEKTKGSIKKDYADKAQAIEDQIAKGKSANKNFDESALRTQKLELEGLEKKALDNAEEANTNKIILKTFEDRLKIDEYTTKEAQKQISRTQQLNALEQELNKFRQTGVSYLSTGTLEAQQALETEVNRLEVANKRESAERKNNIAKKILEQSKGTPAESLAKDIAFEAQAELDFINKVLDAEKKLFFIKQAVQTIDNSYAKDSTIRERDFRNKIQEVEILQQNLSIENQLLQINSKKGLYTEQELQDAEKSLKLREASLQGIKDLANAEKSKADELKQIERDENVRRIVMQKEGKEYSKEDLDNFDARKNAATTYWQRQIQSIELTNKGRVEAINLTYELSTRQQAYIDIFERGFSRMGDAIAEFAKTGKLDFKGLIDSMLSDLIRYELKLQMMEAYKAFRPGAAAFVGGFNPFTFGMQGYSDATSALASTAQSGYAINAYMGPAAKGKAFNQGYEVHKFAMGGAFTNSVVDSPTLFKFAQGTGMMGEAGPEAIMPLKRDGNGNLGVRSEPSNVNVVVNNHSGQPAETRETVDSRGNRTIEVLVGDMVAQQLTTKNSSVQQSLAGTYGTRPMISRR